MAVRLAIALGLLAGCGATTRTVPSADAVHVAAAADVPEAEPIVEPAPRVRVREIDLDGMFALEVILGGADFEDALPTVWAFHGRGDEPRVPSGPFEDTSAPLRVVLPRGPLRLGDSYSWLPHRVAEGRDDAMTTALRERVDEIARAMVRHAERVPYLGRPIVTGFSQGGVLSFALAVLRPDLVGFALPNAGWLPQGLVPADIVDPARYPPVRSTHGSADTIVEPGPALALIERLRALGVDARLALFTGVGHVMSGDMNILFHAWLEQALSRARLEGSP